LATASETPRRLARRTVEVHQGLVDQSLVVGGQADHRRGDRVEHPLDRLLHTLAAVARAAVAQLDGLVLAGGGPGGDRRACRGSVDQGDLDLDGRIAARIEDLAGGDLFDDGHGLSLVSGLPTAPA